MTYTGTSPPVPSPAVRELPNLTITKVSVGPMDNNAYLLRCCRYRRAGADRRGERACTACSASSATPAWPGGHHAPPSGPLAGAGGRTWPRPGRAALAHADDAAALPSRWTPWPTATRSRSATARWRSSTSSAIRRARSRCCTATRPASRTCSPATPCFPAASATPSGRPRTSGHCCDDVETKLFDRLPDETWFYPGHGNDSTLGAGTTGHPGVASARLVTSRDSRVYQRSPNRGQVNIDRTSTRSRRLSRRVSRPVRSAVAQHRTALAHGRCRSLEDRYGWQTTPGSCLLLAATDALALRHTGVARRAPVDRTGTAQRSRPSYRIAGRHIGRSWLTWRATGVRGT